MVVAIPVLIGVWYILAWVSVSKAAGEGLISSTTVRLSRPAFTPILLYCQARLPGAAPLSNLWWRVNPMRISNNGFGTVISTTEADWLAPADLTGAALPLGVISVPAQLLGATPHATERLIQSSVH